MNISLIGMMGSGKTTVGKMLAEELGFEFIDTDLLIIKKEGVSINEIFLSKGEDFFRQLETSVLKEVLLRDNIVISTGGGIVKSDENIALLKEKTICFYLMADADSLYERVKNNNERPLLKNDIKENIISILSQRVLQYEKADFIIDTINKSPEKAVKEILEKLSCEKLK